MINIMVIAINFDQSLLFLLRRKQINMKWIFKNNFFIIIHKEEIHKDNRPLTLG